MAGIGLILLADRTEGRRVHEGQLGCPQCRAKYPVTAGVADFTGAAATEDVHADEANAMELAALMGLGTGRATILLIGAYERVADELARLLDDVQVVVVHANAATAANSEAVSVLRAAEVMPLRSASVRAVHIGADGNHGEAMRVCGIAGRIIVQRRGAATRENYERNGFRVLAEDANRMVAVRVE